MCWTRRRGVAGGLGLCRPFRLPSARAEFLSAFLTAQAFSAANWRRLVCWARRLALLQADFVFFISSQQLAAQCNEVEEPWRVVLSERERLELAGSVLHHWADGNQGIESRRRRLRRVDDGRQ